MVSKAKRGKIPALTSVSVQNYIREIGKNWTGHGLAIELGSWFGATAVPLLEGLKEAGYDKVFYAWDRWWTNQEQVERAKKYGINVSVKQDIKPFFMDNVNKVYSNVVATKGRMPGTLFWGNDPIEICLFDAPKLPEVFVPSIKKFAPHFIPGVTILGLLDFYFYRRHIGSEKEQKLRVPKRYIDYFSDNFTKLAEWPDKCSCVFFRYEGGNVWKDHHKWEM